MSGSHKPLRALDVQDYSDLSRSDIKQLTKILNRTTREREDYKNEVRELIHDLPSHLRSKIPRLTSSCSLHGKLNPLPIKSLKHAIQRMIEVQLPLMKTHLRQQDLHDEADALTVLEDLSALWLHPTLFEQDYGRPAPSDKAFAYLATKCASCILTAASHKVEALITLGACFLGTIKTSKWKCSTRVVWMEEWIGSMVGKDEREDAIQEMWRLGVQLRRTRKNSEPVAKKEKKVDRPYIDQYIREAESADDSHRRRPERSTTQKDHVAFVKSALSAERLGGKNGGASAKKLASVGGSVTSSYDRYDSRTSSTRTSSESSIDSASGRELVADGSMSSPPSQTSHDPILEVKQPDEDTNGPIEAEEPDDVNMPKSIQTNQEDPVRGRFGKDWIGVEKLRPVTIPRDTEHELLAGESEQTRKKLRKRQELRASPTLRIGRKGEIKGPLDKISEASLITEASESSERRKHERKSEGKGGTDGKASQKR